MRALLLALVLWPMVGLATDPPAINRYTLAWPVETIGEMEIQVLKTPDGHAIRLFQSKARAEMGTFSRGETAMLAEVLAEADAYKRRLTKEDRRAKTVYLGPGCTVTFHRPIDGEFTIYVKHGNAPLAAHFNLQQTATLQRILLRAPELFDHLDTFSPAEGSHS
ncbi:hypothetical protein [Arhodomonas sp. AD133]|uniref:hypothetical protein n=1 Tax=Arhodomonas sp. AD133 TaxID=3415009 RepID=UPI003EBD9BC7